MLINLSHYLLDFTVLAQVIPENLPPGVNMENFLVYTPIQRQLISHLLTLGVSAMACGFVYFMSLHSFAFLVSYETFNLNLDNR